jgi:YbbR domain-containing protein
MALIKLSDGERRRLSAFFTCLVLAAFAWLITALSNPYNYTVRRAVTYKNTPQKRAFHPLQADSLNITITGTGWQMLFSRVNDHDTTVTVDLQTLEKENYVVPALQLKQIKDKDAQHNVVSISPDTLYFDFSDRAVKRVPVRLVSRIGYQKQFAQSNNARISPAFVTLTGPSSKINKITYWNTDTLKADNVNETIRTNIGLQPGEGNMGMYPKSISVTVPVDEFTEKTLQIPVRLVNNTEPYNVKVFPQKVKVTFITSLKRYAETDENFFEAQSDLNLWKLSDYSTLPVKLTRVPPFCRIVSVDPPNIDFIIRK